MGTLGAAQVELFTVTQNIQNIYILDFSILLNHQFTLPPPPCAHQNFDEELACKDQKMRLIFLPQFFTKICFGNFWWW